MPLRNALLAFGLVAFGLGAILMVLWLMQAPERGGPAPVVMATQNVLVAAHPVGTGTQLRAEDVKWKALPSKDVPAGYIVRGRDGEQMYLGAVARRDYGADEPLVSASLTPRTDRGFLAAILAPGMRALSITVDAPQSAAGLILPGDHVDAILTQRLDDSPSNIGRRAVAETILRDLKVVAVDQALNANARQTAGGTPVAERLPRTITLQLTEEQAERLTVGLELGKLSFTVHPVQNDSATGASARPVWAFDVSSALGSSGPPQTHARRAGATSIEVIYGTKTSH